MENAYCKSQIPEINFIRIYQPHGWMFLMKGGGGAVSFQNYLFAPFNVAYKTTAKDYAIIIF